MLKNNSGVPSLELLLPLMVTGCLERGLDLSVLSRCLAYNRARHFRLVPRKGALEPGCDADIAIVEPADYRYDPARGHTCVHWSPFTGHRLKARVRETWLRGKLVFDGTMCFPPRRTESSCGLSSPGPRRRMPDDRRVLFVRTIWLAGQIISNLKPACSDDAKRFPPGLQGAQ